MAKIHKLSARAAATAGPGQHNDGGGLYLVVDDSRRHWAFRFTLHGRARRMGLGPASTVSLAMARDLALEARRIVMEGRDPIAEKKARRQAQRPITTFKDAASQYINTHKAEWRNPKHAAIWASSLEKYAFPHIGQLDVASIDTPDILNVLNPIWLEKTETAKRVRGRTEKVLDWAAVAGLRKGENPARWRGHLDHLLASPSKIAPVKHHEAMPWQDMPAFIAQLRQRKGVAARALEFLILTAARSGTVRMAQWKEIDGDMWTAPAEHMKGGKKEHRYTLSARALEILDEMRALGADPDGQIFPSVQRGKQLSDMSLTAVLRRMNFADFKVHGFRSSFKDWASEATSYPNELSEMALAHTVSNAVEAAYRRGDMLEKRRQLMTDWEVFCGQR